MVARVAVGVFAAERAPVVHGRHADHPRAVLAQVRGRSETGQRSDAFDRLVAALQQMLCAPYALDEQPLQRRGAGGRREASYQRPDTDIGLPGKGAAGDLLVEWL